MGNFDKVENEVVIITGAGGGIGQGVARAFAKEGKNLTLTDINLNALVPLKKELESKYNIQVLTCTANGCQQEDVQNVINNTIEQFGRIDTLINIAQASKSGTLFMEHSLEDFNLAISTGLYATFFYMQAAFPYLKESKGSVINFASSAGITGSCGQSSYAAAKEAIRGMSRSVANEWAPLDIRVNVVCPLAMTPHLKEWKSQYPDLYAKTINNIPMKRFGDPEKDIGRVCVFLASKDADFITGQTISVEGGCVLRP